MLGDRVGAHQIVFDLARDRDDFFKSMVAVLSTFKAQNTAVIET
jgi:hypothetical protein